MSNLLKNASNWLEGQRNSYMTDSVTYARASVSLTVNATKGKTDYSQTDSNGFIVQSEAVDFLISVDDLTLGVPEIGDKITDSVTVYEVQSLPGIGHYKYSDSFGKTYRIHTRAIQ